jgi:hypothetical protein
MSNKLPLIACSACQVALEGPTEPKPEDVFTCPFCGLAEMHEAIMREIGDLAHEAISHGLQKRLASVARGNKSVKFQPSKIPQTKVYRFTLI